MVTILEGGGGHLFRATARLRLAAAVQLEAGDLVEMDAGPGFAQVEFGDQTVVVLAPGARVQLATPRAVRNGRPALFLLSGWIKVSNRTGGSDNVHVGLSAPIFDVVQATGTFVVHVDATRQTVYVEFGDVRANMRAARTTPMILAEDGYLSQSVGASAAVTARHAPADFRAQMPDALKYLFPERWAQMSGGARPAAAAGSFDYPDVAAWLSAEPFIRRQFVARWRAKASDPAFKAALLANLGKHPEWGPLVRPPEPPTPRPGPDAAALPNAPEKMSGAPGGADRATPSL